MADKKNLSLSSGKRVQFEEHSNFETPRFYPEKIIRLKNGTVGLVNPHSEYYTATPQNQQKLEKVTKRSTHWFYVNYMAKGVKCR